jgi:alkylhydroperoxidase family enzyme
LALVQVLHEARTLFDEREQTALAWAETVTQVAQTHVPDIAFEAASKVFDAKQLTDLTIAIGLMNTYNRIAIAFRRPPQAVAFSETKDPVERVIGTDVCRRPA